MNAIYTDNAALLELLQENGINIICDEQMRMIISDHEAAKIDGLVNELAPAAIGDYAIEKISYPDKQAALDAATAFQEVHGGTIYDDIIHEREHDGACGVVMVGFGNTSEQNPFGDSWEEFEYEL